MSERTSAFRLTPEIGDARPFGFAQQLLTGFIDRYAGELAKRHPAASSKRPVTAHPSWRCPSQSLPEDASAIT